MTGDHVTKFFVNLMTSCKNRIGVRYLSFAAAMQQQKLRWNDVYTQLLCSSALEFYLSRFPNWHKDEENTGDHSPDDGKDDIERKVAVGPVACEAPALNTVGDLSSLGHM